MRTETANAKQVARTRMRQVGLKVSDEKATQFRKLKATTRWTYTEIFETALDCFERDWKAGKFR